MSKATAIRTTGRDRKAVVTTGRVVAFRPATKQWTTEPVPADSQPLASGGLHLQGMLRSVLDALLDSTLLPAAYAGYSRSPYKGTLRRIAIPGSKGIEMVNVDLILCAVAKSNYTVLHLHGGQRLMVSRTLKNIEAELPKELFIRIHSSHLVALSAITRYIRGNGGIVVLANGEQCPVSRAKKEELLERLGVH